MSERQPVNNMPEATTNAPLEHPVGAGVAAKQQVLIAPAGTPEAFPIHEHRCNGYCAPDSGLYFESGLNPTEKRSGFLTD